MIYRDGFSSMAGKSRRLEQLPVIMKPHLEVLDTGPVRTGERSHRLSDRSLSGDYSAVNLSHNPQGFGNLLWIAPERVVDESTE
jgi:hypothetical protein